jgi:hypothetical protein
LRKVEEGVFEEEFVEEEPQGMEEASLSIRSGSPDTDEYCDPRDSSGSEKPDESSVFIRRSRLYCWVVLFSMAVIGVGLWLLLDYLVWDEKGLLPIVASTGPPVLVPDGPTMSPSTSPNLSPNPAPNPSGPTSTVPLPTLPLGENLIEILKPFLPDNGQSFDDPFSPQSKALDWLQGNDKLWSYDLEKIKHRFALAVFYHSTDGDNWTENRRWLSDTDECTWHAANFAAPCNLDRQYANLVLGDNNIQGTLPAELVLLSNSLTRVDLGGTISGLIPNEYGDLTRLESLRLRGRDISGEIPSTFRRLTSLIHLELSRNSLSGTIAPQLFRSLTNLEVLDLGKNGFSGMLSSDISNLRKLTNLFLEDNDLRGVIPSELANLKELEVLRLDDNGFTALPRQIGGLTNLRTLSIRNNNIGGTLHGELGTLRNLEGLFLNHNSFRSTIPTEFGRLTNLFDGLDLSSNSLTGQVPSELGLLIDLSKSDDDKGATVIPGMLCI